MEPRGKTGSQTTYPPPASREPRAGRRDWLVPILDELLSLGAGVLSDSSRSHLSAARARVAEDRFNLVVLGEFKRGKSTLINALIARDVLPTGVVPLTSVVTSIGFGHRDRLTIRFADGREEESPLAELDRYVTEGRNPGNRLGVELARVELRDDLLGSGLELVDTPGIGSIHSHNTEVARGFLPRVDAALCVLDAGQPLSECERELFVEAAGRVPRLLMVINKIDHLAAGEREEAVQFVAGALRELLGEQGTELFALSARQGDGIEPLLQRLRRLATGERETLLLRSVALLARTAALDAAQAARFEGHAIALPLDELADRACLFEQRIAELVTAGFEAGDLLDRGVERALESRVNEPLKRHAREQEPRLRAALREHVQSVQSSPRELAAELERWIDTTVRDEFRELVPRFELAIADELTELERRYAARVERILEQVQEVAADVFGERASEVLPETGLRSPSRFSFKLTDVEHALDIIVGFGRSITPGALGRRLVIRDAEVRLIEMTDRHAGRLRSELAERAGKSARDYRRELTARVEEAIQAIREAIDRATAEHRRGEAHARVRLDQLAHTGQRCDQLAGEITCRLEPDQPSETTIEVRD